METTLLENLLKEVTAIVVAAVALIASLNQLARGIRPVIVWLAGKLKNKEQVQRPERFFRPLPVLIGVALLCISAVLFNASRVAAQNKSQTQSTPQPVNVRLTSEAWAAFNAKNWTLAISRADECIEAFRAAADDQETDLEKAKVPEPPAGSVTDEQKKQILRLGLVNDVATCFWIKGRAAEESGRKEEARKAYEATTKYRYGRCWDPARFFWSPAKDAVSRLKNL